MARARGNGLLNRRVFLLAMIAILPVIGLMIRLPVIEIADGRYFSRVKERDIISHEFRHSMYDVPVVERLRVIGDMLHLFHVGSPSDAALEYYMIEERKEENVSRDLREFILPEGSVGNHEVKINGIPVPRWVFETGTGDIRIRLTRQFAISYGVRCIGSGLFPAGCQ